MTLQIVHSTVATGSDDPDSQVSVTAWNDDHEAVIVGGTDTGILYNSGSAVENSSVLFVKNVDSYEFVFVGDQYADLVSRWGGERMPLFAMGRLVSGSPINDNTCVDFSVLTATSSAGVGNQYASWNCNYYTTDTAFDWNHLVAFEDQKTYNGSGTLGYDATVLSFPSGNGPVTNRYGMWVFNYGGTGTLVNQYGLYVNNLTKGTNNWGIYTAGATPSYIGGRLLISTTQFAIPTDPKITISKNAAAPATAPSSNALIYAYNVDGTSSVIALDAYGTNASGAFVFRTARGTAASPTNTQSGDFLFNMNVYGYNSTGGFSGGNAAGQGFIAAVATENYTSAGSGLRWEIWSNATGALTVSRRVAVGSGFMCGTVTDLGVGTGNFAGLVNIASTSANSLTVGANGQTNPVLQIDSSTASQAAGLKVTGATAAGTVALTAISSGSDASISITPKGTGTLTLNGAVLDNAAWSTYTPTITSSTGTITTVGTNTGRYKQIGKLVFVRTDTTITTVGTAGGQMRITLPVTPQSAYSTGAGRDAGVTGRMLMVWNVSGNSYMEVQEYATTSVFAAGNGIRIVTDLVYEAS
jgi:hypothetical protein